MADTQNPEKIESIVPAYIKRYGKVDPEELLRGTLGATFGDRFVKYRREYNNAVAGDTDYVPDFPSTVLLELLNKCNLDCIMCDSSHRLGPKITISQNTLQRVYDEIGKHQLSAIMFGAGEEPLLYKGIDDVFANLQRAEVMDIFLFTNGTLLTEERSRQIVERQLSRVFISIDAATPDTYAKIRKRHGAIREGDNRLIAVEENVRRLVRIRNEAGSTLPLIRVSFCVQPENEHEVDLFREKWEDVVDHVEFQSLFNFKEMPLLLDVPEAERWRRIPKTAEQGELKCPQPFYTLTVWASGAVSPCCSFMGKNVAVGNIHEQSMAEIWHGEKINELREQFRTGDLNMICRKCLGDIPAVLPG